MGVLTLSDFQTEIVGGLGNRQDVTLQRVVNVLNMAQNRVSRAYDFTDMAITSFALMNYTGVPAVDKYLDPPPGIKTIHSFVLLDTSSSGSLWSSRKLVEKPWRWFDQRFPVPEQLVPGWPRIYTRWGRLIVMAPPPQAQFTAMMRYVARPTPFQANPWSQSNIQVNNLTQTSDFDDKDDLLVNWSLAYLWRSFGRPDLAKYHEDIAELMLSEAIKREGTRPDMTVSRDVAGSMGDPTPYWSDPFQRMNP